MIINSLLDSDFYKYSMGQTVFHQFPSANVEYDFKCRNKDVDLTPYTDEIQEEINHLEDLRFAPEELNYLKTIRFLKPDFIELLSILKLDPKQHIKIDTTNGFELKIIGPWWRTIWYEIPVLAIINEVYFRNKVKEKNDNLDDIYQSAEFILRDKLKEVKSANAYHPGFFKFSDFGTRRRFSYEWHKRLIPILMSEAIGSFVGTSNVQFAMENNITPIGTQAHEFFCACQAFVRLIDSQKFALETWSKEYNNGELGIALTDTLGMDAFLRDCNMYFTKLYDGFRHDSGDPYIWCDKLIAHLKKFKIDPMSKTAVFSDGLTFSTALGIANHYKNVIKTSFGIGTSLTNDVGYTPLNIVIKMTKCNERPVAKISDSAGKTMCKDDGYVNYLKSVFQIKG
jgi:nicotinate phosphoribosyltransferase